MSCKSLIIQYRILEGDIIIEKPYIDPEIELIAFSLKNDVLSELNYSHNETGGENSGWDWNDDDGDEPLP